MTGHQGVLTVARLAATEAAREFFAPLKKFVNWTSAFVRMPREVIGLSERVAGSLSEFESVLKTGRHVDQDAERILKELHSLKERLDSIHDAERRKFRQLEYSRTDQAVIRYLSLAADLRHRGEIPHAHRVLALLDQLSQRRALPTACYVFFNRGELFFEQGEMLQAESYFRRALDLGHEYDFKEVAGAASLRLALVYYFSHQTEKTADYSRRAMDFFEATGDRDSLFHAYIHLASSLVEHGTREELARALAKATETSARLRVFLLPEPK